MALLFTYMLHPTKVEHILTENETATPLQIVSEVQCSYYWIANCYYKILS